jgi:multidrug resistance efflux pump
MSQARDELRHAEREEATTRLLVFRRAQPRVELDNLKWERDQATIRAPADGVVTSEDLNEGDILEAGKDDGPACLARMNSLPISGGAQIYSVPTAHTT